MHYPTVVGTFINLTSLINCKTQTRVYLSLLFDICVFFSGIKFALKIGNTAALRIALDARFHDQVR